jgi:hypothetical protein
VKKLRAKWNKELQEQGGACYSMLFRALGSVEDAKAYRGQCLEDRKAGHVEEAILLAKKKGKAKR